MIGLPKKLYKTHYQAKINSKIRTKTTPNLRKFNGLDGTDLAKKVTTKSVYQWDQGLSDIYNANKQQEKKATLEEDLQKKIGSILRCPWPSLKPSTKEYKHKEKQRS